MNSPYGLIAAILIGCIFSTHMVAQTATIKLRQAQQAYQKGDYQGAVEVYEQLIAQGYADAALYFNLGNACYLAGHSGKAVLYYEKNLALKPNDEAALENLEQVRSSLTDQIDQSMAPDWWDWFLQPQWLMRPNTLAILFALLVWLEMAALLARRRAAHFSWFPWITRGILTLAVITFLGTTFSYWNTYHNPIGIILNKETTMRIGPEQASPAIRTLHEGTKVAYLDKIGSWDKVRLSNGQEGWLEHKSTKHIQ